MKKSIALLSGICLAGASVFAGPQEIIQQRARELNQQNNVRQGIASPTQPNQPANNAAKPATTATPQQQGMARLQTDLAAIKAGAAATAEQKQALTRDLTAASGNRISQGTISKLANDLADAAASKALPATDRARFVQDLTAALSATAYQPRQMEAVIADVQAIFQANGSTRNAAVAIANDVKAVAAEVQKPAGH